MKVKSAFLREAICVPGHILTERTFIPEKHGKKMTMEIEGPFLKFTFIKDPTIVAMTPLANIQTIVCDKEVVEESIVAKQKRVKAV